MNFKDQLLLNNLKLEAYQTNSKERKIKLIHFSGKTNSLDNISKTDQAATEVIMEVQVDMEHNQEMGLMKEIFIVSIKMFQQEEQ